MHEKGWYHKEAPDVGPERALTYTQCALGIFAWPFVGSRPRAYGRPHHALRECTALAARARVYVYV